MQVAGEGAASRSLLLLLDAVHVALSQELVSRAQQSHLLVRLCPQQVHPPLAQLHLALALHLID